MADDVAVVPPVDEGLGKSAYLVDLGVDHRPQRLGMAAGPTCPHHIAKADSANLRMIIVCDEGYSSSLAAASLRQLGIERATDLIGGFRAWKRSYDQARLGAVEGWPDRPPASATVFRWLLRRWTPG
jgi:rhodanese-related sulfurtransferase